MPPGRSKLIRSLRALQWRPTASQCSITTTPRPQTRAISLQQTPASATPTLEDPSIHDLSPPSSTPSSPSSSTPDARFEILSSTSSLLSIALSASQHLYTRRGSLVGVSGDPDAAISTLSPLSPLLRLPTGISFLYQKITSAAPLHLLVAAHAPHTSFSVLHLDGRVDWIVASRNGLVAWTGHTLAVTPRLNARSGLGMAHWGNTHITGRGLVALAAPGNTYQLTLAQGESYIAHPSHVLAYTETSTPPTAYRFASSTLRFQLPSLTSYLPNHKFFTDMRRTKAYVFTAGLLHTIRTWSRRTIWGDRLFLRFEGPATVLLQSRGGRIRDVLSREEMNEIAEAPMGAALSASSARNRTSGQATVVPLQGVVQGSKAETQSLQATPTKMSYASVGRSGAVEFSKR